MKNLKNKLHWEVFMKVLNKYQDNVYTGVREKVNKKTYVTSYWIVFRQVLNNIRNELENEKSQR